MDIRKTKLSIITIASEREEAKGDTIEIRFYPTRNKTSCTLDVAAFIYNECILFIGKETFPCTKKVWRARVLNEEAINKTQKCQSEETYYCDICTETLTQC
jgi:hypothetical protein